VNPHTRVIHVGRMSSGKLDIDRSALAASIRRLPDGWVTVSIAKGKPKRSDRANAYLWSAVYDPIWEHTGHEPEEIHDIAKKMFLPRTVSVCDGNGVIVGDYVIGGTTTTLNPSDFYHFVERVRQWALEFLKVRTEDPDPNWFRDRAARKKAPPTTTAAAKRRLRKSTSVSVVEKLSPSPVEQEK
jgi:hypothetical protein